MRRDIYLDWSNRIAHDVGQPGGYTDDEHFVIPDEAAAYMFASRALFTPKGYENARALAGDRPLYAHVNLLHVFAPGYTTPWAFDQAKQDLLEHAVALDETGQPAIRFRKVKPEHNTYHVDARLTQPQDYVELLLEWLTKYEVQGLVVDNLAERPWTYPDEPLLPFENVGGPLWMSYQGEFVYRIRQAVDRRWPGFWVLANGRWAMEERSWVNPQMLHGVFWERCGTHWWDVPDAIQLARQAQGRGVQVFDGRRAHHADSWDMNQVAQTLAHALDGYYLVGRRNGPEL